MSQQDDLDNVLRLNAPRTGNQKVDISKLSTDEVSRLADATEAMRSAVAMAKQDKESARAMMEKLAEVTEMYGADPEQIAELLNETDLKNRGARFAYNKPPGFIYYDHRSLCIFKHDNPIRAKVVQLIHHNGFDHFISLVIVMNSIMLGLRDYDTVFKGPESEWTPPEPEEGADPEELKWESLNNRRLEYIGLYLSGIFFAEAILKIVGMGFIWHKNAYLRIDAWNKLDFFVVLVSIMDFVPGLEQYSGLKILRTLRILRPLRSINKIKGMKIIINSFLASIPGLCNVCFFLFFVLSIFGIFGVHQFMGHTYQRCRVTEAPTSTDLDQWNSLGCDSIAIPDTLLSDLSPEQLEHRAQCAALPMEWEMIDEEQYENAGWLCATDYTCQSEYFQNDNICGLPYINASGEEVVASCTCGSPGAVGLDKDVDPDLKHSEQMFFDIAGFEDFIKAMFTIFIAITLEGWSIMMVNYQDAGSQWISPVFFILLVLFGAFFALNLVLAEVIVSFFDAKLLQEEKDAAEAEAAGQDASEDEADDASDQEGNRGNAKEHSGGNDKTPQRVETSSEHLISVTNNDAKKVSRPRESDALPDITGARKVDVDRLNQLDAAYDHAQQEGIELSVPASDPDAAGMSGVGDSQAAVSRADNPDSKRISEEKEEGDSVSNSDLEGLPEEEQVEGEQECDTAARRRAETNRLYGCFYHMVTGHLFNFLIFCLIILNTLLLAADGYPSSTQKEDFIWAASEFFTWIFVAELLLKLIGLGPKNYIADSYNIFDAVVVGISLVDWVIEQAVDPTTLGSGAEALQAIKALRLLRMIKLARSWGAMQDILKKTYASLAELVYVFIILFLFMYIFALLGMELFANRCQFTPDLDGDLVENVPAAKARGEPMEAPRENFDDTVGAITTVFILTIGEDWPVVMYNYTRVYAHSQLVMLYFLITYSMGNFAMLSLFTAVLLSKFEEKEEEIEKEGEESDAEEDDDSKPKKPCKNKCLTFMRNFKLEYYRAFATEKLAQDMKEEIAALEERDETAWKCKQAVVGDRKVAPAPQLAAESQMPFGVDGSPEESVEENHENKAELPTHPSGLGTHPSPQKLERQSKSDSKGEAIHGIVSKLDGFNSQSAAGQSEQKLTGEQAWAVNRMVTRTSEKKLTYRSRSQFSLSHLKVLEREDVDQSEASAKLKEKITGDSLWCLGPDSKFRFECYRMAKHPWFDRIILTFIAISTVLLAIDTPLDDPQSPKILFCKYADYVMTTVFVLEMCVKIIGYGFVTCGRDSYIRDGWNVLDFLIVAAAIFSIIFAEWEISFLKALRLLRILRPLRLISRYRSLKLAITSLINSIPDIVSLLIITNFFIVMMAILCTTLLAGKFYHCDTEHLGLDPEYTSGLIKEKWDCLNYGGEWVNPDLNFDNTPQSILTLMTIQTTEGWIGVMWSSVDAVGVGMEPKRDHNRWYIAFFFLLIVIICLLFLNLFVGIVCETYNTEKSILSLNHKLKSAENTWINVQLQAYSAQPVTYTAANKPGVGACRNATIKLVTTAAFEWFIMGCILANTVLLAVQWYQMDQGALDTFDVLSTVFSAIFTIEAVIKIIAMKRNYFKDTWNVFDFVVVCVTLLVFTLKYIPGIGLDMSSQATIVRVLRVLRVLRLVKRARKLQIIAQTVLEAIPSMGSLGVLLLLFLFLFAVIGNQLFSFVKLQGDLNRQFNFQTFTSSFLLLVRCATGEGWNALMFDTARQRSVTFQCDENAGYESTQLNGGETNGCGYPAAVAYFIVFLFVVCYVFLNLFIAIVVDTYCAMGAAFGLPVTMAGVEEFVELWKAYDPNATGYIAERDLSSLLRDLAACDSDFFSYNKSQMLDEEYRAKWIRDWEVPCYKNFQCYMFYDVLLLTCRDSCMMALYPEAKRASIRKNIEARAQAKGLEIPEDELEILVRQRIAKNRDHQWHFKNNVLSINEKDERIDLIGQLRRQAGRIGRRLAAKNVDTWVKTENWDGLYTSKHVWAGHHLIKELRARVQARDFTATPPVTNIVVPRGKASDPTTYGEEKPKIDKTGQASNAKLQGQIVSNGSMEIDEPPQSHSKMPSVTTTAHDAGQPVTGQREVSDSTAKMPAISPLETRDLRSQTPEMSLPKPSPTAGVLDPTNEAGDGGRSAASGNWVQHEGSAEGTELASTLKFDQDKQ